MLPVFLRIKDIDIRITFPKPLTITAYYFSNNMACPVILENFLKKDLKAKDLQVDILLR